MLNLESPTIPEFTWITILPIIFSLIMAAVTIILRNQQRLKVYIAASGSAILVAINCLLLKTVISNGIITMTMGNWPPPFGISFTVDMLGATFSLISAILAFFAIIYASVDIDPKANKFGFYPLIFTLLVGVNGSFLTGDIFNLYVWFEVILVSSFGLMILGGDKHQLDGSLKYAFLNLIATTFFLIAIGYLYGMTGSLNIADLSNKVMELGNDGRIITISVLFLIAFIMKSAAFPLYFWLPASYHTPKTVVSAIFAGLLTKVGIYAIIRVFTIIFIPTQEIIFTLILWLSLITIIMGAIGALAQNEINLTFGYLVISGIGLSLLGIALNNKEAMTATLFYTIHSMFVIMAIYLMGGIIKRICKHSDIRSTSGIYTSNPIISYMFLILFLSIAGLPIFSGFWAKLLLLKATIDSKQYIASFIILFSSLIITLALGKIWLKAFWRNYDDYGNSPVTTKISNKKENSFIGLPFKDKITLLIPIFLLISITAIIGIFPNYLINITEKTSHQIFNNNMYKEITLGENKK